ncbi:MAG: peptidoglycan DD-metalloendopeptidase family protein [Trichodesmium sp.]
MTTTKTEYKYVYLDKKKVPIITGSTMTVVELITSVKDYSWTAEELQKNYPDLSMSQIYSALAYYWDNQAKIDAEIEKHHYAETLLQTAEESSLVKTPKTQVQRTNKKLKHKFYGFLTVLGIVLVLAINYLQTPYIPNNSDFIRPVKHGVITSEFGNRLHPIYRTMKLHKGIDIGYCNGKPVFASADGTVNIASWISGYGNFVEINHSKGFQTAYAHMEKFFVHKNDWVKKGQMIGIVGGTGGVTGPHLHFELLKNENFINPRKKVNFPWLGVSF